MVRFPNGLSTRESTAQRAQAKRGSYDGTGYDPASRYDPTTMGRIADSDLDPSVDPEEELFDHANHNLELMGMSLSGLGGSSGRGRGGRGGGGGGGGGGLGQSLGGALSAVRAGCGALVANPRCRRGLLFVIVTASVIFASIAISNLVGSAKNVGEGGGGGGGIVNTSNDRGGGGGSQTSSSGSGGGGPADPPPDLASICSSDVISKPGGYRTCQAVCVKAECCFLPDGHWFSCHESHSTECAAYRDACDILDREDADAATDTASGGANNGDVPTVVDQDMDFEAPQDGPEQEVVELPTPPADLAQICSPESLSTLDGYDDCWTACQTAKCCTQPIESCKVLNPTACNAYEPCSVLIGTPATHPQSISSQVKTTCHTANLLTATGVQQCEALCQPGLCCFVEEGTTEPLVLVDRNEAESVIAGCNSESNSDWCDQYAACATIIDSGIDNAYDDADDMDNMDMDDEDLNDEQEQQQLIHIVEEACDHTETVAGRDKCVNVCSVAECCFVDVTNEDCTRQGLGDIDCSHYEACYAMFDAMSGETTAQQVMVPRPPSNLETTCGGTTSTPQGYQKCADACSPAECCIAPIESCRVTNPQMCGAYEVQCAAVWGESFGEVTIPSPPPDLETTCGGVTMSDEVWGLCDDACRPARCCDEDIAVCRVTNPHMCDAYEVHCAVVWGDSFHEVTIPEAPVDLDRRCAGAMLSDDRKTSCSDACRPAACCDTDINVCRVTNPQDCEPYEVHCAEIWGDQYQEVTVPKAPSELIHVCAPGSIGDDASQCSDLCYMAKCCSESIEACKVLNPMACDAYEGPCANYWGDSVTIPDPPANLEEMCSPSSVRTNDGFDRCDDICYEAECCNRPMGSCRVTNPDVCSQYEPCSNLFDIHPDQDDGGGIEIPLPPPGLAALCSPASLSQITGFTDCEDMCDRASCCLEDIGSCNVANPQVCNDYVAPCTALQEFKFEGVRANNANDSNNNDEQEDQGGDGDVVDVMDLAKQVFEACSSDSLKDVQGRQHCQHLCDGRLCCFDMDEQFNCLEDKEQECLAFAACENLIAPGSF